MYWIRIEKSVRIITERIINTHPIVGVHALALWSRANSVAFQMSHSVRIFFPSSYLIKRSIPNGIRKKVRIEEKTSHVSMKMISGIKEIFGKQVICQEGVKNPQKYKGILIFANIRRLHLYFSLLERWSQWGILGLPYVFLRFHLGIRRLSYRQNRLNWDFQYQNSPQ